MATDSPSPLCTLLPGDFLRRYWQQSPLFVPGALPDVGDLLSADDLAWIAGDPEAQARLVSRDGESWQVRHGPFGEADFDALPRHGWSLLVQAVEAWVPALAPLVRRFGFLPAWRIDDCMVSYAPEGSGVGPHVDRYDVFLIQLAGRRRWSIGGPAGAFLPDLPLKVLADFRPTDVHEAGPGDLLYLPPDVPHDGVSLDDDCLTLSIGFRAPSAADLLDGLARGLADRNGLRFGDSGRDAADDRLTITDADVDRAQALLRTAIEDRELVADALACLVTEPRLDPPEPDGDRLATLAEAMREAVIPLALRPDARLALLRSRGGTISAYAEGECLGPVDAETAAALTRLADGEAVDPAALPGRIVAALTGSDSVTALSATAAAAVLAEREAEDEA